MNARAVLARERFKNIFHKFRRHADARIRYAQMDAHIIFPARRGLLVQGQLDAPALGRKFDGVREEIQKHLIQTDTVAAHAFVADVADQYVELLLFGAHLRLHDAHNAVHHLAQRNLIDA